MTEEKDMGMFQVMLETIKAMPEVPEKAEAIAQLYQDYEGMQAIIDQELAIAETDANTMQPEGRQAGQVYVAANPLEHLSAALRQGYGAYQQRKALDRMEALSEDRTKGLSALAGGQFKGQQVSSPEAFGNVTNPSMHVPIRQDIGMNAPNAGPQLSQALRNPQVATPPVSRPQPRAQGPVPVQQGVPMNVNAQQRQPMMNAGPMTRDISQLDEETLRYLTNMF